MRKQAKYIVSAAGVACLLALLVVQVWPQEAAPKLSPEMQARVSSLEVAFHAAVAAPAETARVGMALAVKECGPQLEQVVTSARRSPEATAELRAYLEAALRTCADRYAPGKDLSRDELDPGPQTEDPARNVGLHGYLLLKLAAAEGPAPVREAIGVLGDTLASVSYWGEERFRYLYPDRTATLDREKRDLGGYATSTGAQIAWCLEHFMLDQATGRAPAAIPDTARAVAMEYMRWREEPMRSSGSAAGLHDVYQHRTMEWARRLAEAIPEG